MAITISPDIEDKLRKFEEQLLGSYAGNNRDFYNQWIGGGGPYGSLEEAITGELFNLLGPAQASSSYRNYFTGNVGALRAGRDLSDLQRAFGGGSAESKFTDYITGAVKSGTPYASQKGFRDLFASRNLMNPGVNTAENAGLNLLRKLNAAQLYDLYAGQYRPTSSRFESIRRGLEETQALRDLPLDVQGGQDAQIRYFQNKAAGIDPSKYEKNVEVNYHNLSANFLNTVTDVSPAYIEELVQWVQRNNPGMSRDAARGKLVASIGNMTVGQVLRAQSDYWNSNEGRQDPSYQRAMDFQQAYGYAPSSLEAETGSPKLLRQRRQVGIIH